MKIFQVYNEQRSRLGGEPAVVEATIRVLSDHGHEPQLVMKSSRILEHSVLKRATAFWSGIYNVGSQIEMHRLLRKERPDVVHVHSVYPMFSPSILVACRRANVPVVMTVHTHNLTCPTWFHLRKGTICEECVGGREYRCVVNNCRDNVLESTAYALRSAMARRFRWFHDNVDVLIVLTPFGRDRMLQAGFRDTQISVIPNPTLVANIHKHQQTGEYVAFAGRVSGEKGLDILLATAAQMPDVPFKVAGDGPVLASLKAKAPQNVEFVGRLGFEELTSFYLQSRMLVVPSLWFEPFGMVVVDAMALGVPVIASRIGGLSHIVDDNITGALFEAGNADDLASQVRRLWTDPRLCSEFGKASTEKVLRKYTQEAYYQNLIAAYETAIQRRRHSSRLGIADSKTRETCRS